MNLTSQYFNLLHLRLVFRAISQHLWVALSIFGLIFTSTKAAATETLARADTTANHYTAVKNARKMAVGQRKPANTPPNPSSGTNCATTWGSLANAYFREKSICAVDVLKVESDGFKVPVEEHFTRDPQRKFFLVAPDHEPVEVLGDANKKRGTICNEESPSGTIAVARFSEKRRQRLKTHPNFPFIVNGLQPDIEPLRLEYAALSPVKDRSCTHPSRGKLATPSLRVFKGSKPKEVYYLADLSIANENCERLEWGMVQDKACLPLGSQISDCPEEGPKTDRGSGKPKGVFSLKTPSGEFRFLLLDATFWEYYGHTLIPLDNDSRPEIDKSETAFEEPCLSH